MLSDDPGSVSYIKLGRLDVVRCPSLNRQGVTESRAKGSRNLVVSHTWNEHKDVEICTSENVYIPHWQEEVLYFSRGEKWRSHPEAYMYQFSWVSLWLLYHDCDEDAVLLFYALSVFCSDHKAWQRRRKHCGWTMHQHSGDVPSNKM